MNPLFKRTPLAAGILLALSSPVYSPQVIAAQGDKEGVEFLVNTESADSQRSSRIAMDADGDFAITWISQGQDGDLYGIYAQLYTADGNKAGVEFQVNTETSNEQFFPSIAMDADGDFAITWNSKLQDGDLYGIYAQLYTADGNKAGDEFQVNTRNFDSQQFPSIAMDADGDFAITWQSESQDGSSYGIYAQRYKADGSEAGKEFRVNTETFNTQRNPIIAMDADGDFVISWASLGQDGSGFGVYAQRYTADGIKAGVEFQVNIETSNDQLNPSIAMDADGDFVIAWQSQGDDENHPEGWGIYAQRYKADGTPASATDISMNSYSTGDQRNSSIAMDADGDFVIAWNSNQNGEKYDDIYHHRYKADGTTASASDQITTLNDEKPQRIPSIAMDADGDFVIAWQSKGQDVPAKKKYGIYAQRYEGASKTVDLNIVVKDNGVDFNIHDTINYTLITTNNGTGTAMDVRITDPLPLGLFHVSDDSASVGWNCTTTAGDTLIVSCSKPFMTVGEMNTIVIKVVDKLSSLYREESSLVTVLNTVTVKSAQKDANPADNKDTETTVINLHPPKELFAGSFSLTPLLLMLPLWFRRRWLG